MKFLRILFFVLSLTTALVVSAYDFEANGLYFDIVSTADLTCALTSGPSDHKYTGALVIPDEVEYSGKKLKVVSVECRLPEVSSVKFCKNITKIISYCFYNNKNLTSAEWTGDMVLSDGIFSGCSNLKNLSYKSFCKKIPTYAFKGCSYLSFDLSKVESIDAGAFKDCTSLKVIDLSSIKSFGTGAGLYQKDTFENCGDISLLILGPDLKYIQQSKYNNMFEGCNIDSLAILPSETPLTFNLTSKDALSPLCQKLYLGRDTHAGKNGSYNRDYYSPFVNSDISFIKVGALVTSLPTVYTGWESLGYFEGCKNLEKIIFEGHDINIGSYCFRDTELKSISLPNGTNILGDDVFPDCIENISFGSEVSFSKNTYSNITNSSALKQISFLSVTPPTAARGFGNNVYTSTKLLVPYGSKEAYQKADVWKNFWNIEEMPGVNTEKVEIEPVNTSLNVGDTIRLTGTKYPTNSIDTIQWKNSDVKIASVSHDGLVTAVAPGKTTITVISGKASATCEVTVLPINAEKIALSHDKVSINESDTLRITATISPENTTDKTIKWTSSDDKIATVSKDGIITAIGTGTATISATCGEISASCEVTVYEPNIEVEFSDNTLSITVECSESSTNVSIFTVFGQCIYRQTIKAAVVTTEEIDLAELPSGTYVVHVISDIIKISKRIVKTETK